MSEAFWLVLGIFLLVFLLAKLIDRNRRRIFATFEAESNVDCCFGGSRKDCLRAKCPEEYTKEI